MWELYHKEAWAQKNWCFQIVVLEKILENPLECKEIKAVNIKGNQSWIFIERTDAEAETPILWPPDGKSQLIGKDPGAGKDEGKKRMGQQRMRLWVGIIEPMDMSLSKLQEIVNDKEAWCAVVHGVTKSQTWLNNNSSDIFGSWISQVFVHFVLKKSTLSFCWRCFISICRVFVAAWAAKVFRFSKVSCWVKALLFSLNCFSKPWKQYIFQLFVTSVVLYKTSTVMKLITLMKSSRF